MTIKLRTEQPADYAETEHVTREAFWNHYSPGCNEHYLLHIMRGSPSFIPELDVVAVHGGRTFMQNPSSGQMAGRNARCWAWGPFPFGQGGGRTGTRDGGQGGRIQPQIEPMNGAVVIVCSRSVIIKNSRGF